MLRRANGMSIGGGGTGTYALSAGTLDVGGALRIGHAGVGTLNQSGGTITDTSGSNWYVGYDASATGTYQISGGLATVGNGADFVVGARAPAQSLNPAAPSTQPSTTRGAACGSADSSAA